MTSDEKRIKELETAVRQACKRFDRIQTALEQKKPYIASSIAYDASWLMRFILQEEP